MSIGIALPPNSSVYACGLTNAAYRQKVTLTSPSGISQSWTGSGEGSKKMDGPAQFRTETAAGDIVTYLGSVEYEVGRASPLPSYVPDYLRISLQNFVQWTVIAEDGVDVDMNDCVFSIRWWAKGTSVTPRPPQPLPRKKGIYLEAYTNSVYPQRILLGKWEFDTLDSPALGMEPMQGTPVALVTPPDVDLDPQFQMKSGDTWKDAVKSCVQCNTLGPYHQHTWVARHEVGPLDQDHAVLCIHWWDY